MQAKNDQARWNQLLNNLNQVMPGWQTRVMAMGQTQALQERQSGKTWRDHEVVKGLLWGLLSANTDWSRIEPLLEKLEGLFLNYDLTLLTQQSAEWITETVYPWFLAQRAGSSTLKARLSDWHICCQQLQQIAQAHGSLENWLQKTYQSAGAEGVVWLIGSEKSPDKLRGFGIPLAAEAAKNLGFDIAKPDIHISRIAGCWQGVYFQKWSDQSGTKAPQDESETRRREVIRWVAQLAQHVGESQVFVDNVLWLAAAKSGAWFSNETFKKMA